MEIMLGLDRLVINNHKYNLCSNYILKEVELYFEKDLEGRAWE